MMKTLSSLCPHALLAFDRSGALVADAAKVQLASHAFFRTGRAARIFNLRRRLRDWNLTERAGPFDDPGPPVLIFG